MTVCIKALFMNKKYEGTQKKKNYSKKMADVVAGILPERNTVAIF